MSSIAKLAEGLDKEMIYRDGNGDYILWHGGRLVVVFASTSDDSVYVDDAKDGDLPFERLVPALSIKTIGGPNYSVDDGEIDHDFILKMLQYERESLPFFPFATL